MQKIKDLNNGETIIFDRGSFDKWCVYVVNEDGNKKPPKDVEYFSIIVELALKYGDERMYKDFVEIYDMTSKYLDGHVLKKIDDIAAGYEDDCNDIQKWFTVLYAGMVAEENKENMILKKRIKRLGMHQILIDKMNPVDAAIFSTGMKWRELDVIMKERGF